MATTQPVFVPSRNPEVFADRIAEARELYGLAKGTIHEATCWRYYEATVQLASIATGRSHSDLAEVMRAA